MGRARARRAAGWLAVVLVLELLTRALVYALSPSPLASAEHLGGELGGPEPVLLALVGFTLAGALSVALVALASLGVRERWQLNDSARGLPVPVLRSRTVLVRAAALWLVSMLVFTSVESYLHWRAGLGFHGLACLTGPVHRSAIPVAGALSLLASAAVSAAGHVLRWMRRTLRRLYRSRPSARPRLQLVLPPALEGFQPVPVGAALGARGPPPLSV